jgi:hypothetical protein
MQKKFNIQKELEEIEELKQEIIYEGNKLFQKFHEDDATEPFILEENLENNQSLNLSLLPLSDIKVKKITDQYLIDEEDNDLLKDFLPKLNSFMDSNFKITNTFEYDENNIDILISKPMLSSCTVSDGIKNGELNVYFPKRTALLIESLKKNIEIKSGTNSKNIDIFTDISNIWFKSIYNEVISEKQKEYIKIKDTKTEIVKKSSIEKFNFKKNNTYLLELELEYYGVKIPEIYIIFSVNSYETRAKESKIISSNYKKIIEIIKEKNISFENFKLNSKEQIFSDVPENCTFDMYKNSKKIDIVNIKAAEFSYVDINSNTYNFFKWLNKLSTQLANETNTSEFHFEKKLHELIVNLIYDKYLVENKNLVLKIKVKYNSYDFLYRAIYKDTSIEDFNKNKLSYEHNLFKDGVLEYEIVNSLFT